MSDTFPESKIRKDGRPKIPSSPRVLKFGSTLRGVVRQIWKFELVFHLNSLQELVTDNFLLKISATPSRAAALRP